MLLFFVVVAVVCSDLVLDNQLESSGVFKVSGQCVCKYVFLSFEVLYRIVESCKECKPSCVSVSDVGRLGKCSPSCMMCKDHELGSLQL